MTWTQNYKYAKFGPKTEIFSNFSKTWYSQQIELIMNMILASVYSACVIIASRWL